MLTLVTTYAGVLGGAERTLLAFAGDLEGAVVLACPEGPLAEAARARGLLVMTLRSRPLEVRGGGAMALRALAGQAGHARELRRLARVLRPELLIAWGMRSALGAPAVRAGLRPRPALLVRHVDFLPASVLGRAARAAMLRADAVAANSRAVAEDLDPRGRLGARLSVIPPGIDLAAYDPAWAPGTEREALLLGAIVPWKRPDLALEAVARAASALPDLRLVVAGAPLGREGEDLLERLRARAAAPDLAGRVTFAGALEDPRGALGRAWCLLHCADREPFGSVVLQALATGRPVVAARAGGPQEVVDPGCGRLFTPGDPGAAARALVEVLGDEETARRLGERGRERAREWDGAPSRRRFAELAARLARPAHAAASAEPPGTGLALVTVTHNSAATLPPFLASVSAHLPGARVVVVDSGSEDGGAELARSAGASVIEAPNIGFGRASNAGVEVVEAPVTALVNPDTLMLDDSLARLAQELARASSARRILAPRVLRPDGSTQDTAQLDPASPLLLLRALLPPAALPSLLRRRVEPFRSPRRRRVGWAVGCCLVARTDLLRELGPFDPRIFLFAEDLELGLRAAEAGVETWFAPDARIVHLDAHSTGPAFGGEPFALLARQRRAVIGDRRGRAAARRDRRLSLLTFADRILLKRLAGRPAGRERKQLEAEWRAKSAPADLGH